ncbi:MAG: hypothetical protein IKV15_00710 [Bacteroidaceae bacterium]|nr:hypothetical protein [Bacteroidaceae bacterium]
MSMYEDDKLRRAKRNLGVHLAPSPDELLAVANKGKGNGDIADYTTENKMAGVTPAQPSPLPNTIEMPKGLAKITPQGATQPVTTSPYQDFAKLWQKPITPEEEARRERAARAVQGVAGLGNLMSAFANLTYTGKGAPSQTLPTQSVDAMTDKMTTWKDKLKAEREKYQAAELGAKVEQWKAELDAQHRAQAQANADRAHEENVRQFNEGMEYKKQAAEQERQDRLAQQDKTNEQWEKTHRLAQQRENRFYQEEPKKNKPVPFLLGDNEWIEVPRDKWTRSEIASVYAKIPEDVRKKIETTTSESSGYDKKSTTREIKPTPEQMEQYIGQYKHLPEVANALRKLAGLKPVEPKPEEVAHEIIYTPNGHVLVNPQNPYITGESELIDYVPKNK